MTQPLKNAGQLTIPELVSLLVSLALKVTYIVELLWPSLIEMVLVTLIELGRPGK